MIRLIREDGIEILLNTEAIQHVEPGEEKSAIIKLVDGEILKVKNPVYDISQKTKAYVMGIKDERKEYEKKTSDEPSVKEKSEKEKQEKDKKDKRKKRKPRNSDN